MVARVEPIVVDMHANSALVHEHKGALISILQQADNKCVISIYLA